MSEFSITDTVADLVSGKRLSFDGALGLFQQLVSGGLDDVQIAATVSALKVRGETVDELAGAASALIESATEFDRPEYPFADVVGTGGDGHNTINLSTVAAITAADCGAKIVKHGNRSISSCSGSFDFLEACGLKLDPSPKVARRLVDETGICFLFAPAYHSGMRHAANVRKTLGVRTIFNLLGPLVNPARPPRMLLGVARPELLNVVADVLQRLGMQKAFVVHGSGVDEVAIHGKTSVVAVDSGGQSTFNLTPADFGTESFQLSKLVCHEPAESHRRSKAVLRGEGSEAETAAVAVNAALVLKLFGRDDLKQNYEAAVSSMRTGSAMRLLEQTVEGSQQ